jgi:branched-chain amino acid transport system ATP-binding protein
MLPPLVRPGGLPLDEIYTLFPNLKERARSQGTKLSGGEQQMLAIARILRTGARVLLLDEPTRGIDIGARRAIYQLLFSLARQGLSIIFVSSELDEVMGIADRALVMSEGRVTGELEREDFSEHAFMTLASPNREQPGQRAWAG